MRILSISFFLFSVIATSQDIKSDSTAVNPLSEVVVTAQLEPQSVKKSVHNVRVITREDIRQLAANNLGDVLNQYLNISIRTSGSDGRSTVSLFGLDSQYFKILVDNIPLVSDTGMGTNVDLTQVNLDDVEQIEIIEGSMGVTHGANAVSGILNIITKKKSKYKWEVATTIQEESVYDEFALFDKGRHIQSLKVSHTFNDAWFASVGANRNDFAGFFDDRRGKDYLINDGLRGLSWLPKEQLTTNAIVGYTKGSFRAFYKFDYFTENVDFYNTVLVIEDNYPFADTYFANDRRYISDRFYHHLNINGKMFSQLNYNASFSLQKQVRDIERFSYDLATANESAIARETYQSKEVYYSTGTVSNFFKDKIADLQLGYETTIENGFYDSSAGTFRDNDQQNVDVKKQLQNYDIFTSAEIRTSDKFAIRPGFRYSFQSQFDNQYASSLGFRYVTPKGIELRASLGQSYRTPNFNELYTYFVDSNHNIQGNTGLIPETSTSYEINLKQSFFYKSGAKLSNTFSVTYLNVDDRISLVLDQVIPMQSYRYLNIDKYKMWNLASTHRFTYKNWNARIGAALAGISQKIDLAAQNVTSDDKFLYSLQLNSNVSYNVPKWKTLFSVYYKFNGKEQQFVSSSSPESGTQFVFSELQSYSGMDASVRKTFFKDRFEVTLGGRNLLNVQTVQLSQSGGTGVHASGNNNILLGYGRSAFIKLTYNLNFN